MNQVFEKDLLKARDYVYRLLNIRLRSEKEIFEKLNQRKNKQEIIEATIAYFKELDLINDHVFAQKWIESRLKKPYGANRITLELHKKGVKDSIIKSELKKATENFSEDEIVFDLAKRRAAKYKNLDHNKVKQRVYGYLIRRGFNTRVIYNVIQKI